MELLLCVRLGRVAGGARFCFGCFLFAIFGLGGGFERVQQAGGDFRDFIYRGLERGFVGLGGLVEARDFSDELERCGANFFRGYGGIEVVESLDASAHVVHSFWLSSAGGVLVTTLATSTGKDFTAETQSSQRKPMQHRARVGDYPGDFYGEKVYR
ncbi:MAG: hypothetical protein WA192_16275 [Candidatus Acidiferrales bacterium]